MSGKPDYRAMEALSVNRREDVKFDRGSWDLAEEILERAMDLAIARGLIGEDTVVFNIYSASPFENRLVVCTPLLHLDDHPGVLALLKRIGELLNPVGARIKIQPRAGDPDGANHVRFLRYKAQAWSKAVRDERSAHFHLETHHRLPELLEEIGMTSAESEALISDVQ